MNVSAKQALLIAVPLLVPVQEAARAQSAGGPGNGGAPPPRVPRGIYAVAPIETVLKQGYVNLTVPGSPEVPEYGRIPPPSTPGLPGYRDTFYTGLLMNPAVSGLTLQVHWDTLNPNPPTDANAYRWEYVAQAFASVNSWNSQNQDQPRRRFSWSWRRVSTRRNGCWMSLEAATRYVLQGLFAGTSVAGQYCEPSGAAPLNYLNIYYPDITHADMPKYESQVPVISGCGNDVSLTFQGELNTASAQLLTETSEP
jgi:hypothetical protein